MKVETVACLPYCAFNGGNVAWNRFRRRSGERRKFGTRPCSCTPLGSGVLRHITRGPFRPSLRLRFPLTMVCSPHHCVFETYTQPAKVPWSVSRQAPDWRDASGVGALQREMKAEQRKFQMTVQYDSGLTRSDCHNYFFLYAILCSV